MSKLDRETFNEIVDLLTPLMSNPQQRRALLTQAFVGHSNLLGRISYSGPTQTFVVGLVSQLAEFGEIEPGTPALWALLETARDFVGVDKQRRIDALRGKLGASAPSTQRDEAPRPGQHSKVEGGGVSAGGDIHAEHIAGRDMYIGSRGKVKEEDQESKEKNETVSDENPSGEALPPDTEKNVLRRLADWISEDLKRSGVIAAFLAALAIIVSIWLATNTTPPPAPATDTPTPSPSIDASATPTPPDDTPDSPTPTTAAQETAQPPTNDATLTLFLDRESLTLYVPETASLEGLTFEVTDGGNTQQFGLDTDYPAFQGVPFGAVPATACFRLERSGADVPLPMECQDIGNNLFIQTLASANVFWYDEPTKQGRLVTVTRGGDTLNICPFSAGKCEIDLAP